MTSFPDHFSAVASEYAQFRPVYPPELFAHLAAVAPGHALAVDCGTGSGQAAVSLARHFERIIAIDASAEQVAYAQPHPRVEYCVGTAEQLDVRAGTVDILCAAQSLHWFDLPAFTAEATRVLRPGGVLAVWSYGRCIMPSSAMQRVLDHLHQHTLGTFWPAGRLHVDTGYRDLPLPFPELPSPAFSMTARMSLHALGGYLRTWSATQRHRAVTGEDVVAGVLDALASLWGPVETAEIRWPISLRLGRAPRLA